MRIRFVAFLLVVAMIVITIPSSTEAQAVDSVTYLMGGIPQGRIVGGIVHNITIALTQPAANVTLNAYQDGGFTASNYTTNYSWTYESGTWTDNLYNYYIKNESGAYGNTFCFFVAIDTNANPGTWRWIVEVDGVEEYNIPVLVETPVAGISMSSPTFYPRIFPYNTGHYNSWNSEEPDNSTSLWTKNIGNVPLDLLISYNQLNSLFETSNGTGTFFPGEERIHYVEFQAQSWSPRRFTVKGLIHGTPQLVMTPDTISCIVAPQTTYDVVVTVARQGYDIYQMDGVTVQYKKYYASKYKDSLNLDMYLTGNVSVTLSGEAESLTMNGLNYLGELHTEPIALDLTDLEELHVVANVTCSESPAEGQASILTYANFDIVNERSATGRFTSTVVVASIPPIIEPPPILEANMVVVMIIIVVLVIIGLVLFRAQKSAEVERRKELEDRIRQKKDRARKRR